MEIVEKLYPAIITKLADNDYNVSIKDFNVVTFGETLEDAYFMAEDALKLTVFDMYEDEEVLPEPSALHDIKLEENQVVILVRMNLLDIIKEYDNKAVKKTLTIPAWLNKQAEKEHINYSQLLQEALKEKLNL